MRSIILLMLLALTLPAAALEMTAPAQEVETSLLRAARVTPSPRQYAWQQLETIAFAHFGINTFTDREWGEGSEDPGLFNPEAFDARQWARVCKEAGLKMIIITAKHHDGFCLWPSAFTDHSVKKSPWRGGRGDVVKEVAEACREYGLKFGFYLSPWDRHEASYGDSPRYNAFFMNQLRELLTGYGEVSEVWFDGACGEGPNGKRQVYDFQAWYRLIRELQPNAVIAIMGPDVRWVGTEAGYGRTTEWSVLPAAAQNTDSISASSQQEASDRAFVPGDLTGEDLGSREKIREAGRLVWYPAEADVSIRPGWFYHAEQDGQVKSPEKLVDIFYGSVGRNCVLLLNIPPDRRGLIHENDAAALREMHRRLDATFQRNLLAGARLSADSGSDPCAAADGSLNTGWRAGDGRHSAILTADLGARKTFDVLALQEDILTGQRIEA
ncbi:MAG TPA: alpha-L-fucosidase, partial [bacterium]|nr:alpha-L-fucosidase [bacterium]